MEEWDIEWMESDLTYLWVEISTIWSSKEFNTRLQFIAVVKGRGNDVVTRVPNGITEGEMEDSRRFLFQLGRKDTPERDRLDSRI